MSINQLKGKFSGNKFLAKNFRVTKFAHDPRKSPPVLFLAKIGLRKFDQRERGGGRLLFSFFFANLPCTWILHWVYVRPRVCVCVCVCMRPSVHGWEWTDLHKWDIQNCKTAELLKEIFLHTHTHTHARVHCEIYSTILMRGKGWVRVDRFGDSKCNVI